MTVAESLLSEFDQEMANTRKVLERIPDDKFEWRAHPKSNTIGWNANHLAESVGWIEGVLTTPSFDVAPPGGPKYQSPKLKTRKEILDLFDRNVAAARKALAVTSDEAMAQQWSLLEAGQPFFTMSRSAAIRTFGISHLIHHRAILCVYLRLNNIPVPGMYGPSGGELRRVQIESVRWMADLAKRAGVKRIVLNGSFVTDIMEPNDVDCVLLISRGFPADATAEAELNAGLPFLEIKIVGQVDFDEYVNVIFGTDRMGVPKGMIEVIS